jgi:hypothetical protein
MSRITLFSDICVGKWYKLITFRQGIRITDIMLGEMKQEDIIILETLGRLDEIRQYGRHYDPDVAFYFERECGTILKFEPNFDCRQAYLEYEPDTEEDSRKRVQERVQLLKQDILGNDWALRPENVVATQGLDISHFAP